MTTVNRSVETEHERTMAIRLLEARAVPFTLSLTDGKHRSTSQNRLQHMWMSEIAQQKGDMTPAEVRAYCKLTIGVPLLRAENEAFREGYDRTVRPLSYEQKIQLMGEPLDLPVTRLMTTKQKTQYLDAIAKHFGEQGIILTMPEDMRREIETNSTPGSPPPDAGDDEAGYANTPSSTQPDDQPSSSAADPGQTEAPASNVSPVVDAGLPSNPQLWLLNVSRMLWATANPGGDLDVLKNQKVSALIAFPKPAGCPDQIAAKADAVYRRCQEVIGGSLDKPDALALIAGNVGVDQDDILRKAEW